MPTRISNIEWQADHQGETASALVEGSHVFVRVSGTLAHQRTANPFVIAALGRAMAKGTPHRLEVLGPFDVSETLYQSLHEYMRICRTWWPELSAPEIGVPRRSTTSIKSGRSACFFSGGVDSFYSAVRNAHTLTHLVLCRGLDIPFNETTRWERTVKSARDFADSIGVDLVLIETNFKAELLTAVPDNHGAILIATAIDLGFERLHVPASDGLRMLTPWGSHPLTDPLFSTETTQVIHDGLASRAEKVRFLVEAGTPLASLRVCNRFTEYNCGACEKCLRTSVALAIYGVEVDGLKPFTPDLLDNVQLWSYGATLCWRDSLEAAHAAGRSDIARAIQRLLSRWERKEWIRKGDELFLSGRAHAVLRRLRSS